MINFPALPYDQINAAFEIVGAFINLFNVIQIKKHKLVRGVHVAPFLFFTTWAFWNIVFYGGLQQPLSMYASMVLGTVNGVWCYYYFKYRNNNPIRTLIGNYKGSVEYYYWPQKFTPKPQDNKHSLEHIYWMIEECWNNPNMDNEKINRWLGFIQSGLILNGIYSSEQLIDEAREVLHGNAKQKRN